MLKAPQKQNATDTISTLSSRLASATLLEDRRASILGLRSFAKQYPASVASESLRDLIGCLRSHGGGIGRDGEGDVDTVRLVLETLLMLFNPDESSPEASEDIALWLADEFSQRQDNITILLDLLDTPDYYSRIYSIQLLTAISAARPERTQECILLAPLGTARLVSVLDDGRDAVRDAALLLLVDLTNVSQTELQKLIAFEDAFARIFKLMQAEGGLSEGGVVIQDCLSLLANLIRHSTSNQSLFRESGCMPRLVELVQQVSLSTEDENEYSRVNREKNAWGLLAVVRLFVEKGEVGTKANQDAFWRSGLVQMVLDLAFSPRVPLPIKSSALRTCSDMIIANPPLQEQFAALQVGLSSESNPATNGVKRQKQPPRIYIIEALLTLVLGTSAAPTTETRSAACALIKAYFSEHRRIKHHFLQRAIAGFVDGEDGQSNVLSALMGGPQAMDSIDPLRFVFASDIVAQLLSQDPEAKALLMAVSEGNAEKGEDVITSTQTLSGHLSSCLDNDLDPRISISYLCLLTTFLYDAQSVVNDCLAEGSSLLGSLITTASLSKDSQTATDSIKSLLPGLCAALLGSIYEFSSKDSPIPRRTLQPFLVTRLGRQRYFDALTQLRQHPVVRDSEFSAELGPDTDHILFDPTFIEWYKDDYGRLRRAIDKDPGIEVISRTDAGVDRDVLDDLRSQLASKDQALQQAEQDGLASRQQADQTSADHRKELQSLQSSHRAIEADNERVKRINEALQRDHDSELQRLQNDMNNELERLHNANRVASQSLLQQHEREVERLKGQHGASLASERSLWEDKMRKAGESAAREQQSKLAEAQDTLKKQTGDLVVLRQDLMAASSSLDTARSDLDRFRKTNEQLDQELKKVKTLQQELQQVNGKAMTRVKILEEERMRSESRVTTATEERDRIASEVTELQTKLKGAREESEGLKMELSVERKGYGELEAELEKVKQASSSIKNGDAEKVTKLEKDLKAKDADLRKEVEDAKKARTELEDMLMVMSDIEAKRDEYKERLQKLGEQVSDDEDDDEEDGDEVEGEDEDEDVD